MAKILCWQVQMWKLQDRPKKFMEHSFPTNQRFWGASPNTQIQEVHGQERYISQIRQNECEHLAWPLPKCLQQSSKYWPDHTGRNEEKLEVNQALRELLSQEEIKADMTQMKNSKAPAISIFMTDMIKNLPKEGLKFITSLIQQYWNNPDTEFLMW